MKTMFHSAELNISTEVRHLEGIKSNFAVRNGEYIGIASLKELHEHQQKIRLIWLTLKKRIPLQDQF